LKNKGQPIGMKASYKRVPAVEKCFAILELLAESKSPLNLTQIAGTLALNKSTVFNLLYTLTDLGVLHNQERRFSLGPKLYRLGRAADNGSDPIRFLHPFLEEISRKTGLSVFLGLRSGLEAVIVDKVDSAVDLRVSSEIGIRIPLLAGAGGWVLAAQLSRAELEGILDQSSLKKYTPNSCIDKNKFRRMILQVEREGVAVDREEYLEGIKALAIPVKVGRPDLNLAIWAVGLAGQLKEEDIPSYSAIMTKVREKIENLVPA
jgi:IclR family KDG regulon transcriptional repressor